VKREARSGSSSGCKRLSVSVDARPPSALRIARWRWLPVPTNDERIAMIRRAPGYVHTDHGKRRTVGKRGEGGREPEANKATGPPSTVELYTAAAFELHAASRIACGPR
jgi:hypothetical protein